MSELSLSQLIDQVTEILALAASEGKLTSESSCEATSDVPESPSASVEVSLHGDEWRGRIFRAMESYNVNLADFIRYLHIDPHKSYTRNLIAANEHFALMALCWNPEKTSPIHDHPCKGCWMKVLAGTVRERRYERRAGEEALHCISDVSLSAPGCVFMHDCMGLHSVGNAGSSPAVTLHLYAPPYDKCTIWPEECHAEKTLKPCVTYHSEFGKLVQYPSHHAPTSPKSDVSAL